MAIPNSLKIIILFLLVGVGGFLLILYLGSNNSKDISPDQAAKFVGQKKSVTGTIRSVVNNRKAVYIDFGDPHADGVVLFRARILQESWSRFPSPPEEIYHPGNTITVTGQLEWYQGDPIITATSPLDFSQSK